MSYEKEIELLKEIVLSVGKYQLEKQKNLKSVNIKEDGSPFTEIDVNSEAMIKSRISSIFKEDGFLGEESGETQGTSNRRWIIDPLDGTRPYIRGIPTHSILIALEEDGILKAGIAHFPALNETYWAMLGYGAYFNRDERLSVSKTERLSQSTASALGIVEEADKKNGKILLETLKKCDYTYGFMDAYSYTSVAAGKLDFCVSLIDKPWDRAPAALIVKEAGGVFSDLSGAQTIYGDGFLVSNKDIHEELLREFLLTKPATFIGKP